MRRAAALAISATPATPVVLWGFTKEYWGAIFLLWGALFAVASCASLAWMLRRSGRDVGALSTRRIFLGQAVVWGLSFLVLGVINLTPLCLHQDNGDGRNNLEMCVFLTVLWWIFMSVVVVPWVYAASVAIRKLIRGRVEPA